MKIYVASSWRNTDQPYIVSILRDRGHDVYDFRNPAPGNNGFSWRQVAPDGGMYTVAGYLANIGHEICNGGFRLDMDALEQCDACVLVLPCGRSAHLELGWAVGAGKRTAILLSDDKFEPELMYKMCDLVTDDLVAIVEWLDRAERITEVDVRAEQATMPGEEP